MRFDSVFGRKGKKKKRRKKERKLWAKMGNAISDVSFSNRLDLQAFVAGLSGDGHHILLARLITETNMEQNSCGLSCPVMEGSFGIAV